MYWFKKEYREGEVTKIAWVEKENSRSWVILNYRGGIIKRFPTFRQASQYLASYGLQKRAVENTYTRKYLFTN